MTKKQIPIEEIFSDNTVSAMELLYMKELRDKAKEMALLIVNYCPAAKEQETAIVKLKESLMWANSGICRLSKEQDGLL